MTTETRRVWGESYVPPHNTALQRALGQLPDSPARVLEIGCGAGRFIRTIVNRRPSFIGCGCDLEPLAIARAATYGDGIRYTVGSATSLPYADGSFGLVLVFDVLEHLSQPDLALQEIHRVLQTGGRFHALVPCEGQPPSLHWLMWKAGIVPDLKKRHVGHIQRFTRAGFLELVDKAGLQIESLTYSMHPLGQMRDVASYLAEEPALRRGPVAHLAWRAIIRSFWLGSYVESKLLSRVPYGAVALHLTAVKQ